MPLCLFVCTVDSSNYNCDNDIDNFYSNILKEKKKQRIFFFSYCPFSNLNSRCGPRGRSKQLCQYLTLLKDKLDL